MTQYIRLVFSCVIGTSALALVFQEMSQKAAYSVEIQVKSDSDDLVEDMNGRSWNVGKKGTVNRPVFAPALPSHIDKYLRQRSDSDTVDRNMARMLEVGEVRKIPKEAKLIIRRIDVSHLQPFAECEVEVDGDKFNVYLVLKKTSAGKWAFIVANDCQMKP